ncbi:MAG TPA: hypothetical protein VNY52_13960 [Solirubrobacteraceae bacterium]|nr:hypothetical protein [Solirubrobacteraceae bacterium]
MIKLPNGVALSPGAADGLQSCSEAQIGVGSSSPPACPPASKLGEATLTTPALFGQLHGGIYLAGPESGSIGGLPFKVFLTLAGEGVMIKLPGTVEPNPVTGQITTTFAEDPQLPFSKLETQFTGGPRATLSNPQACGEATTTTDLTPWSFPDAPEATPFSSFVVTGCTSPTMLFAPVLDAGTVSPKAGGFSPFVLTLTRHDGEQDIGGLTVKMPPGLLGDLSSVPLCGEPQAREGKCSQESRIGSVTVAAGSGPQPLWLTGQAYLTGPYNGAPFGLSIVVPTKAGPFDFGNEVVRSTITVDPQTAAITVASGPLPQIKDGVPLRLKTINVTVDRPGFIFAPTDCEPLAVRGTVTGAQGATAAVSSPFQAVNCALLTFKPGFAVSTSGKTSRIDGASLTAKVTYPNAPVGSEANIAKVKVELPKKLPARLTTLQKACTEKTFAENPASCSAAARVGEAMAKTPVLPVPLSGPAYFVSHGGAKFPELVVVLQGDGVIVDLRGETFISKRTSRAPPSAGCPTFLSRASN